MNFENLLCLQRFCAIKEFRLMICLQRFVAQEIEIDTEMGLLHVLIVERFIAAFGSGLGGWHLQPATSKFVFVYQ